MQLLTVEIVRFVDEHQPGFVECQLLDARGITHSFIEKVPVVSVEDLWASSKYPCPGAIACEVIDHWINGTRRVLKVSTELPWHVESTAGATEFIVFDSQVRSEHER